MDRVTVYENDNYTVVIGEAELTEGSAALYKIVNKTYGITEIETTMLPRALIEADWLSDEWAAHMAGERASAGREH